MKRLLSLICWVVCFMCLNAISASNIRENRIIHKEKNGFRWIEVSQDTYPKIVTALSINGDTIIPYSLGCGSISYQDLSKKDPGGYEAIFIVEKNCKKKHLYFIFSALDLSGEIIIPFEKELCSIYPVQTKDGKLLFSVGYDKNQGKKKYNPKFGLLDINGEYLIPPTKNFKIIDSDYIKVGKERLPFPNVPSSDKYEIIRINNRNAINNNITAYRDLQHEKVVHKEKDGYIWIETSNGLYVGVEDSSGNVIIPLDYNEIEYIPIPNREGIFIIKKTLNNKKYYSYVFNTKGEMLIGEKNTIHYIQSTPDIPGYLAATFHSSPDNIWFDIYGQKITRYKYDFMSYDPHDGLCYKGVPINVKIDELGHADISQVKNLYKIESELKKRKYKTESYDQQQRVDSFNSFSPVISTKNYVNPNIINTIPVVGTISTVNTKEEYEEFCRNNKKSDGSNYSYEEYLQIRWPINCSDQTGSYNIQNNNNGSSNKSEQWQICNHCNATGVCPACKNGVFYDKTFGTGSQGKKCHSCNGSGICPICKGQKGFWRHY